MFSQGNFAIIKDDVVIEPGSVVVDFAVLEPGAVYAGCPACKVGDVPESRIGQ